MTTYRRPDYTQQVLDSLRACDGSGNCFLTINAEPYDETWDVLKAFEFPCEHQIIWNKRRLGLNKNSHEVLTRSFRRMSQDDFALHIEDDTVLSPDALSVAKFMLDRWGQVKDIFNISLYNTEDGHPLSYKKRNWFTCWGWGMTRRKLGLSLISWCFKNPKSFAWNLQNLRKEKRWQEMHPSLSRVQNIGYKDGENGRSEKWYRENHRTPFVAERSYLSVSGKEIRD